MTLQIRESEGEAMKRFWFTLTLLIFITASSLASAQSYSIRLSHNTNLRASNSLDARIVTSAPAGSILNVSGEVNRWLRIDYSGDVLWMAGWVSHSRVETEPAPQSASSAPAQMPSNIDNCCFVDRQCHSDQQWTDGYWAYQRGECTAQSQPGKAPPQAVGHAIPIEASPLIQSFITEALNRLRAGSQRWYDYVITGADLIREDPSIFGAGVNDTQRIILIGPYDGLVTVPDMDVNLARIISGLVHEACHIHHRDAGFVYNGYTKVNEEIACVEQGIAVLRDAVPPHLQGEHGALGITHCVGDLTNHPRCRFVRENCEWGANGELIDCPAIGYFKQTN